MKRHRKKIISIIIILLIAIFITQGLFYAISAAEVVELTLMPSPYIDIVLAKGRTAVDLNNFKPDMEEALKKQGIDINKVNIYSIESEQVNIQTAFEWQRDVSPSVGSINITNNGRDVRMQGNPTNAGKNAIWIIPEKDTEQTFTFNYDIDYGDNYNAAGMLLRVQQNGNTLTGYMLSFNNPGYGWDSLAGGANGAIWEFTYTLRQNTGHVSKIFKKSLNISKSGTLTVEITDEDIVVSGGGMGSPVTYVLEKEFGAGFGFFSDHYDHNCSRIGHFNLTGINLTTVSAKKLEEVLREPDFRESSIKVLVNVQDNMNEQLNEPSSLGELLTRTINDEIHFVGWGTDANITESQNFIAANNNNGMFTYNTNYNNAVEETAAYIKSLIDQLQSSQYVLLNEPTDIMSNPSDIMTDTADEDFPYGKWRIVHDCEYFENNIGQFANSNRYISDMITEFNKTGKYEVYYADNQVLPTEIYVHRKPMAEISFTRNGNQVELTSLGYDLDNYSNNRGIAEEEWKYRQVGETQWYDGKLTDISGGTDYLVQLRVKDFQGQWSAPVSKYITKNTVLPIASFKIKNVNTSIYEEIEIVDGSYDPSGGTIVGWKWTVLKDDQEIYSGSTPLLNYMDYGTGNYKMALEVTNNSGQVSERYVRNFQIIPDDEAPEFVANPMNCDWTLSQDVELTFSDRLGSGYKNYQYAITEDQGVPDTYSSPIDKQTDTITINEDGIKYLHVIATDNAGNTSEDRVVGPYYIDKTPPTGTIDYEPKDWVIDRVDLLWSFEDAGCGLDKVILPNGETVSNMSSGTFTVTEDGKYDFDVYDKLGNHQIHSIEINNIDKTEPIIALSQRPSEWTDSTTIISWECSDTQSGFREVLLPDGTSSKNATGEFTTEQIGTYTFVAYDNVGNEKKVSIEVQNIDKVKPKLELTPNTKEWVNEDVIISWEADDFESGFRDILLPNSRMETNKTGIFAAEKNGTYTFVAYDNVGNTTLKSIEITNIDKIPPIVTLELSEKNGKKIVKWELEDNESGIQEMLLPDGTTVKAGSGEFEIDASGNYTFIGYDKAGNMTIKAIRVNV